MADSFDSKNSKKHLFVLVHGLWGNHSHMNAIRDMMEQTLDSIEDVVIFKPKNSGYFKTLHGLRVVSYNVLEEICQFVTEYGVEEFDRISFIGYSMGGLVSRFLVGKTVSQCKELFQNMRPVLFITFATPHLGVNFYMPADSKRHSVSGRLIRKVLTGLGTTILGRSGAEIFISRKDDNILVDLSQGEYLYGLSRFKHRILFGNVKNDRTVAFYTALIMNCDPFIETSNQVQYHFNHELPINAEEYPVIPRVIDLDALDPHMDRIILHKKSLSSRIGRKLTVTLILTIFLPILFTVNVLGTCYSYATTYRHHNALRNGQRTGTKESSNFGSNMMSTIQNIIGDTINNEQDSGQDQESQWSLENTALNRQLTNDPAA